MVHYVKLTKDEFKRKLMKLNGRNSICEFSNFADLCEFLNLPLSSISFTLAYLPQVRDFLQRDINLYEEIDSKISIYFKPSERLYDMKRTINILLTTGEPEYESEIFKFGLIPETHIETLEKPLVCSKTKKCFYRTIRPDNLIRHELMCSIMSKQIIISKQVRYGNESFTLYQIIKAGYLPNTAKSFRKNIISTFDKESIEHINLSSEKSTNTIVHATHKILSIAIGNNMGFSKCWVRKDDSHEAILYLIEKFLDGVEELLEINDNYIPGYFYDAIETLETDSNDENLFYTTRMILKSWLRFL